MRELQRRWQGREAYGIPSPSLPPPLLGCQWVEDPLIREGQVGGVILLPFHTHQTLLGSPEDAENVSLALGFSFCCSQAHGSLSRCSRAVNATAKPDSSCAGWKGSEVLQCLPYARDSTQVDQTELGWILLHQELPCSALVLKHDPERQISVQTLVFSWMTTLGSQHIVTRSVSDICFPLHSLIHSFIH